MDEKTLIQRCIEDGKVSERTSQIVQISYMHQAGMIYIYRNDSEDKNLQETLSFQLQGLQIEGFPGDNEVEINLSPKQ